MRTKSAIVTVLLCMGFASSAAAHIRLLKPDGWIQENALGDPQKDAPCGPGAGEQFTATNKITEFKAGETITVEWEETIPHPGHFRIALAENRDDLKDPELDIISNCDYDPASVPKEPHGNVLLDNLFPRTGTFVAAESFSQKVTLPNKPCEKCTLQLIQYMTAHSVPCIYYHCADIKIVAAAGTAGAGGNGGAGGAAGSAGGGAVSGSGAGMGGMSGMTAAGTTGTMAGASAGGTAGAVASAGTTGGAGQTAAPVAGASGPMMAPPQGVTGSGAPPSSSEEEGCSVTHVGSGGRGQGAGALGMMVLLAMAGVWLRGRRRV
jgi:hypothetical protein